MKTIKNLQAEVEKLGNETKTISEKVDMQERIKDIPTLDTKDVIDKLTNEATIFENCAKKFFGYEINAVECNNIRDKTYWNAVAIENQKSGETIRSIITYLIRNQKQTNLINRIIK